MANAVIMSIEPYPFSVVRFDPVQLVGIMQAHKVVPLIGRQDRAAINAGMGLQGRASLWVNAGEIQETHWVKTRRNVRFPGPATGTTT